MTVIIDLGYITAAINELEWKCDDPIILNQLNYLKTQVDIYTSDPDPDLTIAQQAAKYFNAEITHHDKMIRVDKRIY